MNHAPNLSLNRTAYGSRLAWPLGRARNRAIGRCKMFETRSLYYAIIWHHGSSESSKEVTVHARNMSEAKALLEVEFGEDFMKHFSMMIHRVGNERND